MSEYKRCAEHVYLRDTYRRTGRGRSGFEMHYRREQCKRVVKASDTLCWQHRKAVTLAPASDRQDGQDGQDG